MDRHFPDFRIKDRSKNQTIVATLVFLSSRMGSKSDENETSPETHHPCIIVHGGAWSIPDFFKEPYIKGVQQAVLEGYKILMKGGSAVDGVEAAVRSLEDNSVFNAGRGAVITEEGTVELDAVVMDGDTLMTGAIASVSGVANPVTLAREVMRQTPHCLLVGEGALKFARKIGFPILDNPLDLITEESKAKCLNADYSDYSDAVSSIINSKEARSLAAKLCQPGVKSSEVEHDTVGAVAMDKHGKIAAATSTGGLPLKMPGRVGDSPLVGLGAYANKMGGVSATGHGEAIMRSVLSREVVRNIENGDNTSEACHKAIHKMMEEVDGMGGVIAINNKGICSRAFSTTRMAWASVKEGVMVFGIEPGETLKYSSKIQ